MKSTIVTTDTANYFKADSVSKKIQLFRNFMKFLGRIPGLLNINQTLTAAFVLNPAVTSMDCKQGNISKIKQETLDKPERETEK